jgi:hypothetical protein
VPALHRAVALEQMHDIAVAVATTPLMMPWNRHRSFAFVFMSSVIADARVFRRRATALLTGPDCGKMRHNCGILPQLKRQRPGLSLFRTWHDLCFSFGRRRSMNAPQAEAAPRRPDEASHLYLEASLPRAMVEHTIRRLAPLKIHMADPSENRRWIELEPPASVEFCPGEGVRVVTTGRFRFDFG